ncbi:MAG: radical SAM protein [Acidimicrobiales bacterium]
MEDSARAAWQAARPGQDHVVDAACVAPWVSLEFDPAGWVYACCSSGLYPLGRIGEQRLRDLWNGPRAQVLRDALLRWDLTVACGTCRWHLEHRRMDPVAAVYDQYPVRSAEPDVPHMMLFALSNRCNLGCVMCSPALSSTLAAEEGLAPLPSPYDDAFFADLEPLLTDLRLAKFLGGEPFLAPEHRRVWEMLAALPTPPRLQVTTNGTVWTEVVDWLFDHFQVDISISVDACTPETYSAIRRGGSFEQLMANVDRFAARCEAQRSDLHVSYCLMDRNWHELGRFLRWAERFESSASVNLVTDDGLALHDLPTADLEQVQAAWLTEDLEVAPALDRNLDVWKTQLAQLDAVLDERRAERTASPRHAEPIAAHHLAGPTSEAPEAEVDLERARLAAWSTRGPVAELHLDGTGHVDALVVGDPRLGIGEAALGATVQGVIGAIEAASGATAWMVEHEHRGSSVVRTIALTSGTPRRGARGSVVRSVQVAVEGGSTLLLAEDEMYAPRPDEVIEIRRRPRSDAR